MILSNRSQFSNTSLLPLTHVFILLCFISLFGCLLINYLISTPDIRGKYWDTLCQSSIQKYLGYLVVFQYIDISCRFHCVLSYLFLFGVRGEIHSNPPRLSCSAVLLACYVRLPAKCYCHICRIVKHTIWPFTTLALFLHFLKLEAKIEKTGERTKSVVFDARYLISLTAAGTWQNETTNENSCVSCGKYLGL